MDFNHTTIGRCTFCGYEDIPIKETDVGGPGNECIVDLCKICYNQMVTIQALRFNYNVHETDTLRMMAWIGNHIVEEIKKGK